MWPAVVVDLSDIAEDYGIYTSKDIMERADVRKGDILIINTGYHKYGWDQPEADEMRYMVKHPGSHNGLPSGAVIWNSSGCGIAALPTTP